MTNTVMSYGTASRHDRRTARHMAWSVLQERSGSRVCGVGAILAIPTFVQFSGGTTRTMPLYTEVLVTDAVQGHDTYADEITFTVHVTTDESQLDTTNIDMYDKGVSDAYSDFCRYENRNVSKSIFVYGKTKIPAPCFVAEPSIMPGDLILPNIPEPGYGATIERHVLPLVRGQCGDDAKQLNDVTDMTLHIKPKTIMYGDGYTPKPMLQVRVVP